MSRTRAERLPHDALAAHTAERILACLRPTVVSIVIAEHKAHYARAKPTGDANVQEAPEV